MSDSPKNKKGDAAYKQSDDEPQHRDDADNYQDDLFRTHSARKVGPCEIVDERRIEQQAIDPIENAPRAGQICRGSFRPRAAFKRVLGKAADPPGAINSAASGKANLS